MGQVSVNQVSHTRWVQVEFAPSVEIMFSGHLTVRQEYIKAAPKQTNKGDIACIDTNTDQYHF